MAILQRRVAAPQAQEVSPPQDEPIPKRRVGRPKGEASTIVNVRLPLSLVARLDRYLDELEGQTGLKANRGMMARRALELFLETYEARVSRSASTGRVAAQEEPSGSARRRRASTRHTAQ